MLVHELAKSSKVESHVIRYYVRIGLLRPARQASNGYHVFSSDDRYTLDLIRRAKALGFSLAEIKQFLLAEDRGSSGCCARMREVLKQRIADNRAQIAELLALQDRMEYALAHWGQEALGCRSVDHQGLCARMVEHQDNRNSAA